MTQQTDFTSKASYDDSDIVALNKEERIRIRPESMLGSSGIEGARHGLTEIIGNAVDEHSSGFGDQIDITYHEDHSVTVRDYGRGVPLGWNEKEQQWNWFNIFAELYAGGKYKDYQKELQKVDKENTWDTFNPHSLNYFFSIGLNGLGAASTQYTSEFFEVSSYRDGIESKMSFKHGVPVTELTKSETDQPNGTKIHWKPDDEVFSEVNIGSKFILDISNTIAYVSGISVHLIDAHTNTDKFIPGGSITDMLRKEFNLKGTPLGYYNLIHHGHTIIKNKDYIYVLKSEAVFDIVDHGAKIIAHHNGILMSEDSGRNAHHKGVYLALEQFFKRINKERGIRIKQTDYIHRFSFILNGYSNVASYRGQTKDFVDDFFISESVKQDTLRAIDEEYDKGNPKLTNLIDEIISELEIKKQLEEQKKMLTQVAQRTKKHTTNTRRKIVKFIPSRNYVNKKVAGTQLVISEGDSATDQAKLARNPDTQSVYPIRGKIINALKNSEEDVLANNEVSDLIQIIGGGVSIPAIEQEFDLDKIKFEEIVILTDADKDGYQIRALLMVFFFKFMPGLIESGRLVIAETPILEMIYADGSKFAYNESDYVDFQEQYGQPKHMKRFKGLGSLGAEVLSKTTLDVNETKRKNLITVKFDITNPMFVSMIDALLGKDVTHMRRNIIINYLGKDVADMFEENENLFDELDEVDSGLEILDV